MSDPKAIWGRELTARVDEITRDVKSLSDAKADTERFKAEIATLYEKVRQLGVATDTARLQFGEDLAKSVAELREEVEALVEVTKDDIKGIESKTTASREEFVSFKSRMETLTGIAHWAVGISVAVVVGLITTSVTVAWNASKLHSDVTQHTVQLGKIEGKMDVLSNKITGLDGAIFRLTNKLDTLAIPKPPNPSASAAGKEGD